MLCETLGDGGDLLSHRLAADDVADRARLPGRAATAAESAEHDALLCVVKRDGDWLLNRFVWLDVARQGAVLARSVRAVAAQGLDEMVAILLVDGIAFAALAAAPKADRVWVAIDHCWCCGGAAEEGSKRRRARHPYCQN